MMVEVLERAAQSTPLCAMQFESDKVRLLISLCRELQRGAGDQPFFLGCRSAAELLGESPRQAAKWLRMLTESDVLELVSQGGPISKRASEYRYVGDGGEAERARAGELTEIGR